MSFDSIFLWAVYCLTPVALAAAVRFMVIMHMSKSLCTQEQINQHFFGHIDSLFVSKEEVSSRLQIPRAFSERSVIVVLSVLLLSLLFFTAGAASADADPLTHNLSLAAYAMVAVSIVIGAGLFAVSVVYKQTLESIESQISPDSVPHCEAIMRSFELIARTSGRDTYTGLDLLNACRMVAFSLSYELRKREAVKSVVAHMEVILAQAEQNKAG